MRGDGGRAKSAARYEYVRSPSAFKNKIYPSAPCHGTNFHIKYKKTRGFIANMRQRYIPPYKGTVYEIAKVP